MDTEEDDSVVSGQQGGECVLDELHGITSTKKKEFQEFKNKVETLNIIASVMNRRRKKKRLETWTPEMVEIFQTRHFSNSKYLNSQNDLQSIGPFHICSSDPINYKLGAQETEVTILDCDDILRETISFLDYYSLNKMSYVSKRVNRIVTSLKKEAAHDLINRMPFGVDVHRSLGTPIYCPTFHFNKSWDPKYNDFDILDFDRYPDGHPSSI
ncbi:predicted protein [Chaetoceros tenuissimus]|uniref:F-box domain-containing protein n=1 Tax=Chaetoceros tenuissimus TaxID=426638 RepID=A0AAD3H7Y0_9STRA|nr:predicted protein [Chaetoceros tenuissimus]